MDIVYYVASSVDGFIATDDGGVDWLNPYFSNEFGYAEFYASVDVIVMGSHTYEFALTHGGSQSADKPSRVFTSRDLPAADPSVTLTSDDPSEVVETLRAEGHERVWLMGGGELAGSFRARGLISEYQIWIMPVVLGGGIPLFAGRGEMQSLTFAETQSFGNGVVMLRYKREEGGL